MADSKPNLGEQALSKVVELGLTSQLDEVEQINVDIRTDPLKLVQGKVDSVEITGEGMVMKQDLRMEAMEISTGNVSVNPLSIAFGKVELTQSTDATANVVLTEADINRALSSDYLRNKMQNLEVLIDGKPTLLSVEKAELRLAKDDELTISASVLLQDTQERKRFSATAKPSVQGNGQRIALEVLSAEGQGLSLEFVGALFEILLELLDLRKFELEGITLRLNHLSVRQGRLLLQANTLIEQFPTA